MDEQLKDYVIGKLESGKDSLITLKGGAAIDMVDHAIQIVLQNICDINTTMGVREITLKLKAKPIDEDRCSIHWGIEVPCPKLCGQDPIVIMSDIKVDANGSGPYSQQKEKSQLNLPFNGKVVNME